MNQILFAAALALAAQDTRPPARWMPPPVPVMELKEVVVYGKPSHDGCCGCGGSIFTRANDWDETYGRARTGGTELKSWTKTT